MGTLGHKVFEPIVAVKPTAIADANATDDEPLLYFNRTNLKAIGRRTSEGFVVFKGSAIAPCLQKSCPENVVKFREKHKAKIDGNHILLDDILFTSPSAAAAFVGGSSLSGNELWKTADGVSLKNLEKADV